MLKRLAALLSGQNSPAPFNHPVLGKLTYYKDKDDEYWELAAELSNSEHSAKFNFITFAGTPASPHIELINTFLGYYESPAKLWAIFSEQLNVIAQENIPNPSSDPKDNFYLKTFTIQQPKVWQVGFHGKTKDMFVEFDYSNGEISLLGVDEGCCSN